MDKKISDDKKKQVNIIKNLAKNAQSIVNAGDPDDEGQLLVDELLEFLEIISLFIVF
ncbi:toprim domain-containing protein (plasmid) [Acinetobacter variabilis]|nr:toprim domain-containing protein [Acinetobacter variabilis]